MKIEGNNRIVEPIEGVNQTHNNREPRREFKQTVPQEPKLETPTTIDECIEKARKELLEKGEEGWVA